MTLKYDPVNWLHGEPRLLGDEALVAASMGHYVQHGIARGGVLYLTNKRLIFVPNRLEILLGGRPWSTELADLVDVGRDPPKLSPFRLVNCGWQERLVVTLESGVKQYFIVCGLKQIECKIQEYTFGTTSSSDDVYLASGTSRLDIIRANLTRMNMVVSLLCIVIAVATFLDDIRDDTWVITFSTFVASFLLAPSFKDLVAFNPRITDHATTAVAITSIAIGLVLHQIRPLSQTPLPLQTLSMLTAIGLGGYLSIQFVLRSDSRFQREMGGGNGGRSS